MNIGHLDRRAVAEEAARVSEEIAPPHLRQAAFVSAAYAILQGKDPRRAVRYVVKVRP